MKTRGAVADAAVGDVVVVVAVVDAVVDRVAADEVVVGKVVDRTVAVAVDTVDMLG